MALNLFKSLKVFSSFWKILYLRSISVWYFILDITSIAGHKVGDLQMLF